MCTTATTQVSDAYLINRLAILFYFQIDLHVPNEGRVSRNVEVRPDKSCFAFSRAEVNYCGRSVYLLITRLVAIYN